MMEVEYFVYNRFSDDKIFYKREDIQWYVYTTIHPGWVPVFMRHQNVHISDLKRITKEEVFMEIL